MISYIFCQLSTNHVSLASNYVLGLGSKQQKKVNNNQSHCINFQTISREKYKINGRSRQWGPKFQVFKGKALVT